jgi:hypothetical protein
MSVELNKLREIGWTLWDPIGLLGQSDAWNEKPFADEYDGYLLQALGKLRNGHSIFDIVEFIVSIEIETMGLNEHPSQKGTAQKVAMALALYNKGKN